MNEWNLSNKIEDVYTDYTSVLTLKVSDVREFVKLLKNYVNHNSSRSQSVKLWMKAFDMEIDKLAGEKLI